MRRRWSKRPSVSPWDQAPTSRASPRTLCYSGTTCPFLRKPYAFLDGLAGLSGSISPGTIAVDTVGVALAAFGVLNPLMAPFIHVTSELAFILNSARLLPV